MNEELNGSHRITNLLGNANHMEFGSNDRGGEGVFAAAVSHCPFVLRTLFVTKGFFFTYIGNRSTDQMMQLKGLTCNWEYVQPRLAYLTQNFNQVRRLQIAPSPFVTLLNISMNLHLIPVLLSHPDELLIVR